MQSNKGKYILCQTRGQRAMEFSEAVVVPINRLPLHWHKFSAAIKQRKCNSSVLL